MSKLGNKSICGKCEYYRSTHNDVQWCDAFPPIPPFNGIPDKFASGEEEHREIIKGQLSAVCFKEKAIMPIL